MNSLAGSMRTFSDTRIVINVEGLLWGGGQ